MADAKAPHRPSIAKLSKTPSWVMAGFILGALFVLALPRHEPPPRPIILAAPPPEKRPQADPPQLTTIEAVFEQWSPYAVWDNDVTQAAMWNSAVGEFAEFYEVRCIDGVFYFRSIPRLTNRILRHGKPVPPECPLRFTETDEQYREWLEHGRTERPAETTVPVLPVPRSETPKPHVEVDAPRSVAPPAIRPPSSQ